MIDLNEARRNWGTLPEILEQGIETLPQLLVYQAQRLPDRVFHRKKVFGIWKGYTWGEVLEQVRDLAMGLVSLGVQRGQTVAIVGGNEPELFWCEYSAQAIGAKVVCLYPDVSASDMEYLLVHSESVVVICEDQEQVDKVLELEKGQKVPGIQTIIYWNDRGMWRYKHPKLKIFKKVQEIGKEFISKHHGHFEEFVALGKGSDIAVISYKPGPNGFSKGSIITHSNLLDSTFRLAGAIPFRPSTHYLSYIPPASFPGQVFGLTIGLLTPCIINFPEEAKTAMDNIREIGTEALVLRAGQWKSLVSLVESKMADAGSIRRGFFEFGMTVGQKVNLALLEGRKVSLRWRVLYFLANKLVLFHLRDKLGLQSTYLAVSAELGMTTDVMRFFHTIGVKLRKFYSTTEMGFLTGHQGAILDLETEGEWLPVLPRFGSPLEYKVKDGGELLVRGGAGFSGYYRNPEATTQKILNGWYCTGDVVNMTEKKELIYLG